MTVDATLASIDGALEDWGTSGDAMRWQPDPARVICDGGRPMMPEHWSLWRHGDYAYRITAVPSRAFLAEAQVAAFAEMGAAIQWTFAEMIKSFTVGLAPITGLLHVLGDPREHIRCHTCNPAGNPLPLAVNGADYRRRQQARRRRR